MVLVQAVEARKGSRLQNGAEKERSREEKPEQCGYKLNRKKLSGRALAGNDLAESKPPEMNHKLVKILPRTFKSADSRICPNTMQEISSPSPTVSMKKGIPPGIW